MRLFFSTLLLFITTILYSEESNIQFQNLNIMDGLSQNSVYTILQDSEGFMWFGTTEGLNRYDGNEFKIFKFDIYDSTSLSDNVVETIIETSNNEIWIGTRGGGINIYNKLTEKFQHIKHNPKKENSLSSNIVRVLVQDTDKNIWIGTDKGLNKFNPKTGIFSKYEQLNSQRILTIFEDKNSNIWVGSKNGLIKIKPLNNEIEIILKNQPINNIIEDVENNDQLWLAMNSALATINIQTKHIHQFNYKEIENVKFTKLITGKKGLIWLGSEVNGLFSFDVKNREFKRYFNNPSDNRSISSNQIISIYKDKSGLLWVGTKGGGVNKLTYDNFHHISHNPNENFSISNNNIWSVYEDMSGILWIGTEDGLNKINKKSGEITIYKHNPNNPLSISSNRVVAICEDKHNNFWVGTIGGGLNLLNRKTGEFKHYKNQVNNPASISGNDIITILNDSFGELWIGTRGAGLNKFNYNNETFSRFIHDPSNNKTINSNVINTIYESFDGTLWISATGVGLDKFDRMKETFKHYTLDVNNKKTLNDIHVLSIAETNDRMLWIGTFNGGLNKFDPFTEEFSHITTNDALFSNIIYSIEVDNKNNLWLSSNGALSKYSISDHSITNYTFENGLENLEFNMGASCKGKDGLLYFGGIKGVNYFNPNNFNPEIIKTSLHFTKLVINNETIHYGIDQPINKPITFESQIILNYNEYPFSIYFSALNFEHSKSNKYKYRIEKINTDWIEIGNENKITFTKLPPGKYKLEIEASNSFNLSNNIYKSIDLIIIPPVWKRLWFILFEILLFIVFIVFIIKYRERKIKRDRRILEQKVKERTQEIELQKEELKTQVEYNLIQKEKIKTQNKELELHKNHLEELVNKRTVDLVKAKNKAEESDRLKNSFLANISHEIRTPMNAIVGFSDLLKQTGNPSEEQLEMLNLISFSSNSLLDIINDIVDIAKLEIGEISIKKSNSDINILLNDLLKTYKNSNELNQKKLNIKLSQFAEPLIIYTDHIRVKQVFIRLLDNAIKYTDKGSIEFGYKINKEENQIEFYVKDTGIGLSELQKDDIFKMFRKVESDHKRVYRGIGLGLSFCQKLVDKLDGDIWVKSQENIGSTFYFSIPLLVNSKDNSAIKKTNPLYNWSNKSILIAEDEINNFKFIEAALKSTQAKVFHAFNGLEAVEIMNNNENHIDLILMDIKMPEMDGLEATRIIRQNNKNVKIIAFTAYAMSDDEVNAINYGCDDYISKPAKPQFIMQKISEYLS